MKMSKMSAAALAAVLAVSAPLAGAANNALSVTASAEETTESISENGLNYTVKSDGTLALQGADEDLTEINIPNEVQGKSVTEIASGFFTFMAYTGNVYALNIPDSVTNIDFSQLVVTFDRFDNFLLKEINVSEGNEEYWSEDGVLFEKDTKTMVFYPCEKADTSYTIPAGVETIMWTAFRGCKNLRSITIPNGVKWITLEAFYGCENLTSLNLPASVEHINENIYYYLPDEGDNICVTMPDGAKVYDQRYSNSMSRADLRDCLRGCENLAEINVDKNNKLFYSEDGVLFYKDYYALNNDKDVVSYDDEWNAVLVKYPPAKSEKCYTIPDNNVYLAVGSLYNNKLKTIVIPSGTRCFKDQFGSWLDENFWETPIPDIYYCGTEEEWNEQLGGDYGTRCKPVQFNFEPETSAPEESEPETSEPTESTVTPGDTDKTSDNEDKQETLDATLKSVDSENGLSGEELEKQLFGDSGWTWAQTEKIEFTSDKLFSVQYTATDGSTKTLGEQTAARAEDDGIWNTAWTLDTSLLSKDKPSVKLIAKDGTADITAKVFIKKGAEKPSTDTEKPSNSDQKPSNSDQKPTGIALAIAPVVLAAGAVIVISKKRK